MTRLPIASLRPWTAALALSAAIHAGIAAGTLALSGLVEPPRPEAVVPVELVFAATPAGGATQGVTASAPVSPTRNVEAAAGASLVPPETAPERAEPSVAAVPAHRAAAEPPPPLPRRKPAPPVALAARDPVGTLVAGAAAKAPGRVASRPAESPALSAAFPDKADRPDLESSGRPGSRPSGPGQGRQNSLEQRHALVPDTPEGTSPAARQAARAGAGAALVPPRWGVPRFANKPPAYPVAARRRGAEGRVVLRVRVSAGGAAETVEIARSSGHDLLDEAARRAVERWRFAPGKIAGVPVAASVDVPIAFRLTDR